MPFEFLVSGYFKDRKKQIYTQILQYAFAQILPTAPQTHQEESTSWPKGNNLKVMAILVYTALFRVKVIVII